MAINIDVSGTMTDLKTDPKDEALRQLTDAANSIRRQFTEDIDRLVGEAERGIHTIDEMNRAGGAGDLGADGLLALIGKSRLAVVKDFAIDNPCDRIHEISMCFDHQGRVRIVEQYSNRDTAEKFASGRYRALLFIIPLAPVVEPSK